MTTLLLAFALAQEPAIDPSAPTTGGELPPAATEVPHAEAPAGAPGGSAVTTGRGLLIRFTDGESKYPAVSPVVELESPSGTKQAWPMRDDGEQPDNLAADRSFAAVAQVGADTTLTLRLYDGATTGPKLFEGPVELDLARSDLDVIVFAEGDSFRVQSGRPPQPSEEGGGDGGAGLLGGGGGGLLGAADPQAGGQTAPGGSLSVAGLASVLSAGLVALGVGVPALGLGFLLGRRRGGNGARPLDGGRGHPLLASGAVAVVVPPADVEAAVVALAEGLGRLSPVLVLPAPERRAGLLAAVAARTANGSCMASLRPEAKAAAKAAGLGAVLVDGAMGLEATLADEAADTVINELFVACPRACVVVVEGGVIPARAARTVVLAPGPDGLVGEGLRLLRTADGLLLAVD